MNKQGQQSGKKRKTVLRKIVGAVLLIFAFTAILFVAILPYLWLQANTELMVNKDANCRYAKGEQKRARELGITVEELVRRERPRAKNPISHTEICEKYSNQIPFHVFVKNLFLRFIGKQPNDYRYTRFL